MAFDVANDLLCDILKAFVDDFESRSESVSSFAHANGLTFQQAWDLIRMSKNLPPK